MKEFLIDSVKKVYTVFENDAFKRVYTSKSTSINKTVSELQIVVLSRFDIETIKKNKDKIKKSFTDFINNNSEDLFTKATNNTTNVEKRYEWGKELSNILI